ncbi:G1/S-specific cyclin CLN1 [Wickerhamomyces ciferrii]|uniref:G1/S-specific cyclin CLN1 n=1 Tax=Wickerhamomyces ciferrii (strain ATCC 14091 / BCRC 22168 / CBS 111 / JCM 3599 / NBRC 0793 / NRRL Y-1031 F-60-10) TaxID=1206466 RepID=K0KDV4_WICCF|nr:G1/S-specific cyclin CLN1 [Wickerhamomyces ciferrii]CCH41111.1 G1/S-specific cyclin CLN1 [Wickerhamomyces ciferrii]
MALGLRVTATQKEYPFELSTNELLAHKLFLQDYKEEISQSMYDTAQIYKPDLNLINQQPELKPYLRTNLLEFLLKISIKTKVTTGIFYQSVRIFDRYCSKRIVLKDQVQLVLVTCLWLSAKTYGGCNHIINNTNVPTGGRFQGPNPRSRIPRLSELAQLCGKNSYDHSLIFDENMIIQMERHILNTLNWDVCEPQLNNWLMNFYENNYIQFENLPEFKTKCDIINLKKFLAEISIFEQKLIKLHPSQLSYIIFQILGDYFHETFESDLLFPINMSTDQISYYKNLILDKILTTSDSILNHYFQQQGIRQFYNNLLTLLIRSDSSSTIYKTPSKSSSISSFSIATPPSYSPNFTKKPMLPTPPTSRRGSPAGVFIDHNNKLKIMNNPGFSPPLTPVDQL